MCNGEDAVAGFGHIPGQREQRIGVFFRGEHREHTFGCAFDEYAHSVPVTVERGGELPLGFERNLIDHGMPVPGRLRVPAQLTRHREQRHVGRVASPDPSVVAQ